MPGVKYRVAAAAAAGIMVVLPLSPVLILLFMFCLLFDFEDGFIECVGIILLCDVGHCGSTALSCRHMWTLTRKGFLCSIYGVLLIKLH